MNIFKFLFSKPEWKRKGYKSRSEYIFFHPECRTEEEIKNDKIRKTNEHRFKNLPKNIEETQDIFYCWV